MYKTLRVLTLYICLVCLPLVCCAAPSDALPSWNAGAAKQAIVDFVKGTVDPAQSSYVPPQERIATFDQDGTLWVEQPLYTQAIFALERVQALAKDHPEWNEEEPFKAIIKGDRQAVEHFSKSDWIKILTITHSGMNVADFQLVVKQWLATAKHPRFNLPFTSLVYQPMLEVLEYLRTNGFKTYMVTGGGQEFARNASFALYGIPAEQVIGSSMLTKYVYENGIPVLKILPKLFFLDNFAGKAEGINLFIGKRPYAAFGNSDGDKEMLEWTQAGDGRRLMMLVYHDDNLREYAYGPAGGLPDTRVGAFSEALLAEAHKRGWIVISMKNDWKRIFPFEKD